MPKKPLSLPDWIDRYYLSRDVQAGTVEQVRYSVRSLEAFLVRTPTLADLDDDTLNRWIDWRLASGRRRATVRTQRGALLTLWYAAFESNLVKNPPRRVKVIRGWLGVPEAYSIGEAVNMLRAADKLRGKFRRVGVSRAAGMRAWLLAGWDTGLRPGDLLRLRFSQVGSNGTIVFLQHKTNWPVLCKVRRETAAAIDAIDNGDRELIFPLTRKAIWYWWRRLRKAAGLKGSPKWLRRSSATAIEISHPGSAMAHLGHKTPGLAYRHYVDPRLIQSDKPMPPRIA